MKRIGLRRVPATLAAGAALAVLALTGCGGGDDDGAKVATAATGTSSGSASASASPSMDPQDKMLAFARCLREHGMDVKTDGDGMLTVRGEAKGGGMGKATDAEKACASLAPGGVGEAREPDPQMQDRMLKFATCMREHGVDMPDPGADGGIRVQVGKDGKAAGGVTPDDPKFKAAQEACKDVLGEDLLAVENGDGPAAVGGQ